MPTVGVLYIAAFIADGPPAVATDAAPAGFYVAGDIGIQDGRLETEAGFYELSDDGSVHLRAGYRVHEDWRIEVEASQRASDFRQVCWVTCFSADDFLGKDLGDFERTSLHLNLLYDLPFVELAARPFIGVGVGATRVSVERGSLNANGDDLAWSGQLVAGAAWAVTPRLSLDLTYRYVRVADVKVYGTYGAPVPCALAPPACPPPPPPPDGINVGWGPAGETFGEDHVISIGVRYALGRAL